MAHLCRLHKQLLYEGSLNAGKHLSIQHTAESVVYFLKLLVFLCNILLLLLLFTHPHCCCCSFCLPSRKWIFNCISAPPALVASLGGQGLLWYLRPRIQSICVNLYPSNPSAADDNLCTNILRDSLDPGALAVMISGSKLPPPRTANELLGATFGSSSSESTSKGNDDNGMVRVIEGKWSGPVLIAQGMKDPLNDAVGRANMFQALRDGIEIAPLDGGHCPHVS